MHVQNMCRTYYSSEGGGGGGSKVIFTAASCRHAENVKSIQKIYGRHFIPRCTQLQQRTCTPENLSYIRDNACISILKK